MGGATSSQKTSMTLQIKVKFSRMCHLAVEDRASWAITALVTIALRLREKPGEKTNLANSAEEHKKI